MSAWKSCDATQAKTAGMGLAENDYRGMPGHGNREPRVHVLPNRACCGSSQNQGAVQDVPGAQHNH